MFFPTIEFAIFFIAVFFISWGAYCKPSIRKYILLIASFFFCGYSDWRFALLLLISSYSSYWFARFISKSEEQNFRRKLLISSIILNLFILAVFKYYGFFIASFNDVLGIFRVGLQFRMLEIIFPIGISFFTLQAMSYVFDVYKKELVASESPLDVILLISFFPKLLVGPVVRSSEFLPQLSALPDKDQIKAVQAITLILGGLFKKVVIANYLALQIVDPIFRNPTVYSSFDLIFASFAFAIQIYFNLSAFSDIAAGIGYLLGYNLPVNFDHPFNSYSLREFWSKWFISISTWFRDYIFIPLGGSRNGRRLTYRNLFFTMLLGGFWFGTSWNFIFWGALNGAGLIGERYLSERYERKEKTRNVRVFSLIYVFTFISFTLVFLRSESISSAFYYFSRILKFDFSNSTLTPFGIIILALGIASNFIPKDWGIFIRHHVTKLAPIYQAVLVGAIFVLISSFGLIVESNLIYFNF
jgi:D-alanyl-lipoteichoic acid acyltransferase DltB (MBOAT superfamily)